MTKSTKKDIGAILHKDGVTFRVWAPFASNVSVCGTFKNWQPFKMNSEGDGYWAADVAEALAGQEYKFIIENGQNKYFRNDPRALQVTTNTGNSVIVDTHFPWKDSGFNSKNFNEQVIYELHVGTFNRSDPSTTGTFEDVISKLDYLVDLGVTTIELMPICTMSQDRGWGYAPDYLYAIETLYGGRHDFLKLVETAHEKGLAVILDVVYNHLGPSDNLNMWQFDGWSENGKGGIYFYNDWRSKTPWADTRFDYGRAEVRQFILDNVRMWMHDCHLDGLRVDSTIFIRNVEGHNDDPGKDLADGWSILQRISNLSRKIKPNALVIGEDIGYNDYITKPSVIGGAGFSSQWEINFPQILRNLLDAVNDSDRHFGDLRIELDRKYNGDAFQRVIYTDSHDSAANGGARLDELISPGNASGIYARKRSLLAAAIMFTAPGIPMLLQGQEFMQGGSFNDWQELNWSNTEQFPGILMAYKHLIALRRNLYGNSRGLCGQSFTVIHQNEEAKVLSYHRWDKGGPKDDVVVFLNFSNKAHKDYHMYFPRDGKWRVRFNSSWKGYSPDFKELLYDEVNVVKNDTVLSAAPYSVLVFSQDD